MRQPLLARGTRAAALFAVAVLVVAALGIAGCSSQPGTPRVTEKSCVQFGTSAVRHRVTVTSLPPACQGLTAGQIDAAIGAALRSVASGVHGKAQQRQRIAQASHYLTHMFVPLPAAHSAPPRPAPASRWLSRSTLSLIAVGSWLITVALGLSLLTRRMPRRRGLAALLRGPAGRLRLPALSLWHLGLAALSLLTWIVYLATATTAIAWAAAGLLPLVAGLGMALLFLPHRPGPSDGEARRPPVLTIGAHVIFATVTILFAVLTAVGTG